MSLNLKSLIAKLDPACRSALEGAASLCISRTNYEIEVEHFLSQLIEQRGSELQSTLPLLGVDQASLSADLARSLDNLKTGNARTPQFSPTFVKMLTEAWTLGSVEFSATQISPELCLLALVNNGDLLRLIRDISNELGNLPAEELRKDLNAKIPEAETAPAHASTTAKVESSTPNLDAYTENLTAKARLGMIDPVLGRDTEIRQIVDTLIRRRQNNPILTGEAGVGKTAIVEGLALRIAQGDVPPPLKNVAIHALDLTLLQAGAGIRGEFENRLKRLIEEVKSSPSPIILFIDEAHNLIGAGGQAGQNDAANILKPALARGELRTIAATTWSEYKKYFERDPALARRFQLVNVEEPSEPTCTIMLRALVSALEKHHGVRILDEAVEAAVKLSHRYITGRQLPDKAVSVLDTACARVSLAEHAAPPPIERLKRKLNEIGHEKRVLERETATGGDHLRRLGELGKIYAETASRLSQLETRFTKEVTLVRKVRELRERIELTGDFEANQSLRLDLEALSNMLNRIQNDAPLVRVSVDSQTISEVVSAWTGIPTGNMVRDELETTLALRENLGRRIIGQDQAVEAITRRLEVSRAGMEDPSKPFGVFLLAGPSGVGKTETAHALADLIYGGNRNLICLNMSEFQEPHSVSTLKGSPPGYVGYGEGGVLTEAVRRKPYSVILLDEAEKAHPDILELFSQVFDQGKMEDGEGRQIDFRNTVIILTTNAGSQNIVKACGDRDRPIRPESLVTIIREDLARVFKPGFLSRLEIVPYQPVHDQALKQIVNLRLNRIKRRLEETHRILLSWDEAVIDAITKRCSEVESGARNVDCILSNTLLPQVSRWLLEGMAASEVRTELKVGVNPEGGFYFR